MDEDNSRNETLDGLERNAERDRAELIGTVEALRGRFSSGGNSLSDTLSAQARGYAERRRSEVTEGVWRRIENHPLQTVALAAGIAYPVVRVVTKIPAPILLLGAGVALAGRGGSVRSEKHTEIVVEPVAGAGQASPTERGVQEPRMSAGGDATAGAETTGPSDHRTYAGSMSRLGERAVEAGRTGGETVVEGIQRNPAIAGGVSLLIGAALAAMLPRTRAEGRAFGKAAKDIRERAQSLAAEGIETGRRMIGAAADEAETQNLTGADGRNAIRDGADRVGGAIRDAADEARDAIDGSTRAGSHGEPKGKSD